MKVIHLSIFSLLTACQTADETQSTTVSQTTATTITSTTTTTSTFTTTSTTTAKSDECADYRTEYPTKGYGTSVGGVLADFPGMVDRNGTPRNLAEIYTDRTKQVLVIANAFDT